ncbi:MAG: hypothetical protein ACI4O9_04980 [Akkermansia sp.]
MNTFMLELRADAAGQSWKRLMTGMGRLTLPYSCGLKMPKIALATFQMTVAFS